MRAFRSVKGRRCLVESARPNPASTSDADGQHGATGPHESLENVAVVWCEHGYAPLRRLSRTSRTRTATCVPRALIATRSTNVKLPPSAGTRLAPIHTGTRAGTTT